MANNSCNVLGKRKMSNDEGDSNVDTFSPSKIRKNTSDEREELVICNCCFEEVQFEDCGACNEGDLFCKSCIKKSAEVRIGDGESTFPCLQACGAQLSLQLLQSVLQASVFYKLQSRIQREEVRAADVEGLEFCPFCEFAAIPPPETSVFSCLSPECLKDSCRKCHKVSHISQRCEELESDDQTRARKYIEDEMTKALVRECYNCKKSFIKLEGCNRMTCVCGAQMCYICRQPVNDYTHFNGPGGLEVDKCPLFSTDKVLHEDAVKVVSVKALKRVQTTDPLLQLKHSPTTILPTTREKTPRKRPNAGLIQKPRLYEKPPHVVLHTALTGTQTNNLARPNAPQVPNRRPNVFIYPPQRIEDQFTVKFTGLRRFEDDLFEQ